MSIDGLDSDRLHAACQTVRADLLAERSKSGHWPGRLSSSPLSTATAISALLLAHRDNAVGGRRETGHDDTFPGSDVLVQSDLSDLIINSLNWLATQQNDDGGWGDTDQSLSNIATTMLVRAAFQLTGVPARFTGLVEHADQYIAGQGGVTAVKRRYGKDKTFAAPILTNCALVGLVPWSKVPALPFEFACIPPRWYRLARMPVVSYAIPALVAIGQAKFQNDPPRNPLLRRIRKAASQPSLAVLQRMQPASGGFLEATPLTSFVVMSLASIGQRDHPVVQQGVEFLLASVREDGSWPIDTDLATWNTTLALNALAEDSQSENTEVLSDNSLQWLLDCQQKEVHPYTDAQPGGWAWTNLSGGVPDGDDTPGALLALSRFYEQTPTPIINQAAANGANWLLDLQNRDGGWPTFCRGWGKLAFDRSSTDLTAHALRALAAWQKIWQSQPQSQLSFQNGSLSRRIDDAISRGLGFLKRQQQADGSWLPLWFGNQFHSEEANPVYGTAKVLLMFDELGLANTEPAQRGAKWLASVQLADGGWGTVVDKPKTSFGKKNEIEASPLASVEETALAVEALLPRIQDNRAIQASVQRGLQWLIDAIETGRHREPTPIGYYFAKLWYYEKLYPLIFATGALTKSLELVSHDTIPEFQHAESVI